MNKIPPLTPTERKRLQRDRQRAFLKKYFNFSSADALVTQMETLDDKSLEKIKVILFPTTKK